MGRLCIVVTLPRGKGAYIYDLRSSEQKGGVKKCPKCGQTIMILQGGGKQVLWMSYMEAPKDRFPMQTPKSPKKPPDPGNECNFSQSMSTAGLRDSWISFLREQTS